MRELTLFETGCLASLLVASLVLPMMLSVLSPTGASRKISTRIVWVGQVILGAAGAVVLMSRSLSLYAAVAAVNIVMICASALISVRNTPAGAKA
jgi:hypothetical protein